jgi:hypothetical protein
MNKKMMLLAVAAVSAAMLAVPAFASAQSAHLSLNPGAFTLKGGVSNLSRVAGGGSTGQETTGSGNFENTTTGTIKLTFHKVNAGILGNCASTAEGHSFAAGAGTVTTTTLPFHLITLPTESPAILITPSATGHFASYTCQLGTVVVGGAGKGVIGTITSPKCGEASTTAVAKFTGTNGVQAHTNYTGTKYTLESSVNGGAFSQSAMTAEATITFGGFKPTLICTHTTT